jgi:Lipase (class 3)
MPAATDLLCCFEGGTGAIRGASAPQQYAGWSLMGFVLARTVTDVELKLSNPRPQGSQPIGYDLYIVFRGSRSGKLRPQEAGWKEKGNPDWVTDFDLFKLVEDKDISALGSVCRGFGTSLKTMLPTVLKAIEDIASQKGEPPRAIYVTGHSLGAALACHFTSAMVCGTKYGPRGAGTAMPDAVKGWPWSSIQLVTFSSPVVGGKTFQHRFDRSIGSRRVWLDGDPITSERRHYMVGLPYWVRRRDEDDLKSKTVLVKRSSHEPYLVRRNLILSELKDMPAGTGTLTGVPAGTGKDDTEEPWKLCKFCGEMIDHLESLATKQHFKVKDLFPDFTDNFRSYLEIFQKCHPELAPASNTAKSKALNDLITNVRRLKGASVSVGTLAQYWTAASDIQGDEEFGQFIGLCLFLANVSEGFGSVPTGLAPLIDRNTGYKSLLRTQI